MRFKSLRDIFNNDSVNLFLTVGYIRYCRSVTCINVQNVVGWSFVLKGLYLYKKLLKLSIVSVKVPKPLL